MPLQNRVDPWGNLHAVTARGTCMGNRGILHHEQRQVWRYHQHQNWIICRLSFAGRKRLPMAPGRYTELFFLDEATALAAGHRPCAECNRPRYQEFVRCWRLGNPGEPRRIDVVLHEQRFVPRQADWRHKKRLHPAWPLADLPVGAMILLPADPTPYLVGHEWLWPWAFTGYGPAIARPAGLTVTLLTPPATVRTLAAGYRPQIHPSQY